MLQVSFLGGCFPRKSNLRKDQDIGLNLESLGLSDRCLLFTVNERKKALSLEPFNPLDHNIYHLCPDGPRDSLAWGS